MILSRLTSRLTDYLDYLLEEYGTSSDVETLLFAKNDAKLFQRKDVVLNTRGNHYMLVKIKGSEVTMIRINRLGDFLLWFKKKTYRRPSYHNLTGLIKKPKRAKR